jgi:hypothetical protein
LEKLGCSRLPVTEKVKGSNPLQLEGVFMGEMNFVESYEIGFPTFQKIFEMESNKIKGLVKEICKGKLKNEFYFEHANVTKITENDEVSKITLDYYDYIEITPWGIQYLGEHKGREWIVRFDKFFTLPII